MDVVSMFKGFAQKIDKHASLNDLTKESKVSSLGIDSLSMMEIIGCFEDELGIKIADDRLATIQTVGDIERVILLTQAGNSVTSASVAPSPPTNH
jgi:acyl carrier protein